jgi:hypothetical protein
LAAIAIWISAQQHQAGVLKTNFNTAK